MLAKTLCDMKQGYTQFGGRSLPVHRGIPADPVRQVFVRSVCRFCISGTTRFTASSCITRIRLETILDGRRRVSAPTIPSRSSPVDRILIADASSAHNRY
jgi:hypothetical protein